MDIEPLIEQIYDGVFESRPWQSFMLNFRKMTNCQVIGMWLQPPRLKMSGLSTHDLDPDYEQLVKPFFSEYFAPLSRYATLRSGGEIKVLHELVRQEDIEKNRYYQNYLKPNRIIDGMQITIREPNGLYAWIGLGRAEGSTFFGDRDIELTRKLLPHLSRALRIYSAINRAESHVDIYEDLVDRLSVGIIILDSQRNIIKINHPASILLVGDGDVTIQNQTLRFLKPEHQKAYTDALDAALKDSGEKTLAQTTDLLRLETGKGSSIGLLIRKAIRTPWYQGKSCPAVILYVCDPSAYKSTREGLVSKLFGLTISEASLAILLADGLTLAECAKQLNINENSARTVSKKIFAKTGTKRQAELIRLILNSTALLR